LSALLFACTFLEFALFPCKARSMLLSLLIFCSFSYFRFAIIIIIISK
jgi:hypothetical protein